ncbi:MAG: hypothetical protein Q9195_000526 [Heterodermia aff. obscurata]
MSNTYINLEEGSSPLHEGRGDSPGIDSPYARVEQNQPPHSPLFFGSDDDQPTTPDLPDYDDITSDPRSAMRPPTTNSANEEPHSNGTLQADEFLDNLSVPAPQVNAWLDSDDFLAACSGATHDMWVKIDATSKDDLRRKYHQRHNGNSDPRDMDLVLNQLLPSMLDVATAMVRRVRSECNSVVQDQVFEEYQAYADENRESFIQKLTEEALPQAKQRVKHECDIEYQKKLAASDKKIEDYEDSEFHRINKEVKERLDYEKGLIDEEIKAYRSWSFSREQELRVEAFDQAYADVDEKVKNYRKQEEEGIDQNISREKEYRKEIMRSNLDMEIAGEREDRIAEMEEELIRMKATRMVRIESEVAVARDKMLAKVADEAASEKGADEAPVNNESTPPPSTSPGVAATASAQEDGNAPTGDNEGIENIEGGDSEDIEGDTTLINDTAKSPLGRGKTSRGMCFPSLNRPTTPASTAEDERPAKRSRIEDLFGIDFAPPSPPPTDLLYDHASIHNEQLIDEDADREKAEKTQAEWSGYFRSSGLNCKLPAPPTVAQNTIPHTTPSTPQNADAGMPQKKQKCTFGKINNLNEDEGCKASILAFLLFKTYLNRVSITKISMYDNITQRQHHQRHYLNRGSSPTRFSTVDSTHSALPHHSINTTNGTTSSADRAPPGSLQSIVPT